MLIIVAVEEAGVGGHQKFVENRRTRNFPLRFRNEMSTILNYEITASVAYRFKKEIICSQAEGF